MDKYVPKFNALIIQEYEGLPQISSSFGNEIKPPEQINIERKISILKSLNIDKLIASKGREGANKNMTYSTNELNNLMISLELNTSISKNARINTLIKSVQDYMEYGILP